MSRYDQLRLVSQPHEQAPQSPTTFRVTFIRTEQFAIDVDASDRLSALTLAQRQWRDGMDEYQISQSRESGWTAIPAEQAKAGAQ